MSRAQPSQTLFLPELPSDITDGVLERHFRGFVGYESCRTRNDRNGKLVGFLEFESIEDASRARESMQGANWHIEFSRDRAPEPYKKAALPRQQGYYECSTFIPNP